MFEGIIHAITLIVMAFVRLITGFLLGTNTLDVFMRRQI